MKSTDIIPTGRRICRNQRGVSLVETMVALTLLAISSATVGDFIVKQTRVANNNNLTSIAQSVAEEQLEDLRTLDYADIAPSTGSKTMGSIVFTIQTTVQANTPAINMKQILVDVSWTDTLATQHVTVHTIYTAIRR